MIRTPRSRIRRKLLAALLGAAPMLALAQSNGAGAVRFIRDAMHLATLVERIAKLQLQLGEGVLAARAGRSMAASVQDFDRLVPELVREAPPGEARENAVIARALWPGYRAWAAKPPDVAVARGLGERNEELAWVAEKAARLAMRAERTRDALNAYKAGEIAMLAQRIAKLHLQRAWAFPMEPSRKALVAADAALRAGLDHWRAADALPENFAAALALARDQYAFLQRASEGLARGVDAARNLEFVVKAADSIADAIESFAGPG